MPIPHAHAADGTDAYSVKNSDGSVGARFDTVGRRRAGTTATPTKANGAGAGTSPTITVAGTDEHGTLTVVAGTTPAAGTLATLTFKTAYATTPVAVIVSPNDSASAALNPYASSTTTVLTLGVQTAPTAAATYKFNYQVVGGA